MVDVCSHSKNQRYQNLSSVRDNIEHNNNDDDDDDDDHNNNNNNNNIIIMIMIKIKIIISPRPENTGLMSSGG